MDKFFGGEWCVFRSLDKKNQVRHTRASRSQHHLGKKDWKGLEPGRCDAQGWLVAPELPGGSGRSHIGTGAKILGGRNAAAVLVDPPLPAGGFC